MRASGVRTGGYALTLVALTASNPASAEWRYSAGVGTEVYAFTESRDGAEDIDGAVATVQPFLGARRLGNRFSFGAEADLAYRRSLDTGEDDLEPGARVDAAAVLVERALRFDVGAASRLRDTSPIGAALSVETDAASGPDGDADLVRTVDDARFARVDSLELGPTLTSRLGERTRLDAAYRFGVDRTSDDDAPDGSRRHSLTAGTRTWLDGRARTALRLVGEAERAEADGGVEASVLSGVATLVHAFSPKLGVSASVGRDRIRADALPADASSDAIGGVDATADGAVNDAATDDVDESGTVYGAAIAWRPLRNVAALLSWTERSFGGSPAASITVTGRRSAVRLSWTRSLAIDAGVDLGTDLVSDLGSTGAGVDAVAPPDDADGPNTGDALEPEDAGPGTGGVAGGRNAALFARDFTTVDERVTLDYTVSGRVTEIGIGLAHVRRETIDGDAAASGTSLSFGISRALGRRATLAFDARYAIDDDGRGAEPFAVEGSPAVDDELRRTRVGLSLNVALR